MASSFFLFTLWAWPGCTSLHVYQQLRISSPVLITAIPVLMDKASGLVFVLQGAGRGEGHEDTKLLHTAAFG